VERELAAQKAEPDEGFTVTLAKMITAKEEAEAKALEEKASRDAEAVQFANKFTQLNAHLAKLIGMVSVVHREPDL
jgi:hypothetical protein